MPEIILDDGDKALLGCCPFEIVTLKGRALTKAAAAEAARVKKLWAAGYVHGAVVSNDRAGSRLRVSLSDKGRVAIGRAPIPAVLP